LVKSNRISAVSFSYYGKIVSNLNFYLQSQLNFLSHDFHLPRKIRRDNA
jgi:hypothetical protein